MALHFQKVPHGAAIPDEGKNIVYLVGNNWDDFGNKTQFHITIFDDRSNKYELGDVKIGFRGQTEGWTHDELPTQKTQALPEEFFSLGQDVEYYKSVWKELPPRLRDEYLVGIRDIIASDKILEQVQDETVFKVSLTRGIKADAVFGQFQRILRGDAELTPFYFRYYMPQSDEYSEVDIDFNVTPESKPPTNIHVLIGRNGIGKTTLLNNMVSSLVKKDYQKYGAFLTRSHGIKKIREIDPDKFFSRVISVSFSAFDSFIPPPDQDDLEQGIGYTYIGLKRTVLCENGSQQTIHKDHAGLCEDFINSIIGCFKIKAKRKRWETAIKRLESDKNFEAMNLIHNLNLDPQDKEQKIELEQRCRHMFETKLSSGHSIVLLTITRLVEKVDEKTLVVLDEPESHLHPPLLSAFTRALSYLLLNRNGVALIATHSPVILQEVPL